MMDDGNAEVLSRPPTPRQENKRLDVLVGRWRSQGQTVATRSEPSIRIVGSDTYEWLAGGFFLIHRVDVRMNDDKVEVIEMIGPYDPSTQAYAMRSFDNQGDFAVMQASVTDDDVWTFSGDTERATLVIAKDGDTMTATWERSDNGSDWRHWMSMTFTKVSP